MNYQLIGKMRRLRRVFNVCPASRRAHGVERSRARGRLCVGVFDVFGGDLN